MSHPQPTAWTAAREDHPKLVDRLVQLWALATTPDQRYHLEMVLDDVERDADDPMATAMEAAVDDIADGLSDVRHAIDQLRREVAAGTAKMRKREALL